jgi:hypothetical protein
MVTTPSKQGNPPAPTGLKTMPKIAPAELATNAAQNPKYVVDPSTSAARADPANSDKTGKDKFELPDKVTQREIRDNSFHYGGGRSAGNRSLIDNRKRQDKQP